VTSRHEHLCPSRFIPAAELDAVVWRDLCAVLQTPAVLAAALHRARNGAWLPATLRQQQARTRAACKSLERQQERLLDAYVAGALDLATFEKRRQGLADREGELAARARAIPADGQRRVDTAKILASMTEVCARLRRNLETATFEQRRELVELLIDRVVVTDDDVEIRYVVPTAEGSLHTRFGQLRQDYLHHPAARQQHEAPLGLGVLDHLQLEAVGFGRGRRRAPGVTLVDVGQLDRLAGHGLHTGGQRFHLRPILLVGRGDHQGQQMAQGIDRRVHLGAALALGPVVAGAVAALGRRLERAAVQDHRARVQPTAFAQPQQGAQIVHQVLEPGNFSPRQCRRTAT
jgi:hypothetical protein